MWHVLLCMCSCACPLVSCAPVLSHLCMSSCLISSCLMSHLLLSLPSCRISSSRSRQGQGRWRGGRACYLHRLLACYLRRLLTWPTYGYGEVVTCASYMRLLTCASYMEVVTWGAYMGLWRLPSLTSMTLRISSRTGRTSSCCDSRCHVYVVSVAVTCSSSCCDSRCHVYTSLYFECTHRFTCVSLPLCLLSLAR